MFKFLSCFVKKNVHTPSVGENKTTDLESNTKEEEKQDEDLVKENRSEEKQEEEKQEEEKQEEEKQEEARPEEAKPEEEMQECLDSEETRPTQVAKLESTDEDVPVPSESSYTDSYHI
jgi:uncharacterized protein YlxW (UPF0749 family)